MPSGGTLDRPSKNNNRVITFLGMDISHFVKVIRSFILSDVAIVDLNVIAQGHVVAFDIARHLERKDLRVVIVLHKLDILCVSSNLPAFSIDQEMGIIVV